jgi:putative DNA primase/helicase
MGAFGMMSARELKQKAAGQWAPIVSNCAPQLTRAIEKTGRHVPCPIHGGKDGFRVFKDFNETGGGVCNTCGEFADGLALLQWANGSSFKAALEAVNECLGGSTSKVSTLNRKPRTQRESIPNAKHQQSINSLLNQSIRINWPLAKYLISRGLNEMAGRVPSDLKAVESLPYWHEGKQLGAFPAMIGVIRNLDGDVVSLHRTYLSRRGGKANVPAAKKLMTPALQGQTAGCAIQLYKPTTQLAITEGIETALAVHLGTGLPVWAAISATMLEKVKIPSYVKDVFIMADKDRSGAGARSASILASRLVRNHTVRIIEPSSPIPIGGNSIDWLDVYQREIGFNREPLSAMEVAS